MQGIAPNNVIRIPSTIDTLFRYWIDFLFPFHHLANKETEVATAFLKERYELSKKILDKTLLDKILMSKESQNKIREKCNVTYLNFQVIKSKLKKKQFLMGESINPRLIPNIKEDKDSFQLLLLFDIHKDV